jgi:hypothetical protein
MGVRFPSGSHAFRRASEIATQKLKLWKYYGVNEQRIEQGAIRMPCVARFGERDKGLVSTTAQ